MHTILEKIIAGKWIAGPKIGDAINKALQLNSLGESTIINYLGEEFTERQDVSEAVKTYVALINEIRKRSVNASVSVKITQLGLRISEKLAEENYVKLANFARSKGIFLWLDMESSDTVSATIRAYKKQVKKGGVGIAIQAYLRRSAKDVASLVQKHAVIRLVKGAYSESSKVAFKSKQEVNKSYESLMLYLFKNSSEFTIATHDSNMIEKALELNRVYRKKVTYAMLNGIRSDYAKQLAMQGEHVAIYVPFGPKWVDYAYRRMREQGHISLILRSLISSK